MKSARIFVLLPAIVLLGLGLSATPRNWGQEGTKEKSSDAYNPVLTGNNLLQGAWRKADPEMDKLMREEATAEREVAALIESYTRTVGDKGRSEIRSKVAAALEKEFDLQQKRRDLELGRVEARLKKVRELMKKRSEARQSIIEKRLDQLLREADGLGWTPPAGIHLQQNQGQGNRPAGKYGLQN